MCLRIHALWISLWSNVGVCLFARNRVYADVGYVRFENLITTSHFSDFFRRSNFAMVLHQQSTMLAWVSLALAILAPLLYYIHHTLALPPRPLPSAQSGFSSIFIVMCSSEHALTLIFGWVTQCWNDVTFLDTTRVYIMRNFVFLIPLGYG